MDTPRTDELVASGKAHYLALELARQLERELLSSQSELERVRKDAERYAWLRSSMRSPETFDSRIDKVMVAEKP